MVRNTNQSRSRRSVLKALGTCAAVGTIPVAGSARPDNTAQFKALWEAGLEVREHAGIDKWNQWLSNQGFTTRQVLARDYVTPGQPKPSSDGFSTQNLEKSHIDRALTVSKHDGYEGTHVADFYWDWVVLSYNPGDGEPPKDPVTIGWNDNFYDHEQSYVNDYDYNTYESDSVELWENRPEGATFKYKDDPVNSDKTYTANVGTYMNAIGSTSSLRDVIFNYYHTWDQVDITGISWGSGGPAIQFGNERKRWLLSTEVDEGANYYD